MFSPRQRELELKDSEVVWPGLFRKIVVFRDQSQFVSVVSSGQCLLTQIGFLVHCT